MEQVFDEKCNNIFLTRNVTMHNIKVLKYLRYLDIVWW